MEDNRPDELFTTLNREDGKVEKGKLKIFFGILPGVGKTYAMLQAAQADIVQGKQVIVAGVFCNDRPETAALLENITIIPCKKTEYKDTCFEAPDLDAILAMHPHIVLLANMAYTNAPGYPYTKRYQEIQRLLDNGIDVFTTLNVSQLENYAGIVACMTGKTEQNTAPVDIFMKADEVELVDITPEKYIARLSDRKLFNGEWIHKLTTGNVSSKEKISSLRKLAHHMVMDRIDIRQQDAKQQWLPQQKLMVLVGADVFSEHLIRRTHTIACLIDTEWAVLYIETQHILSEKEKKQLADNLKLAGQLGADIITYSGNELVKECLTVARRENISHIVVGKTGRAQSERRFIHQLIEESGNINIYVYGSEIILERKQIKNQLLTAISSMSGKYALLMLVAVGISLVNIPLVHITGYLFLPFVLLMILFIMAVNFRIGITLLSAILIVVVWIVIFMPPRFSFRSDTTSNLFLFITFFVIALINGFLVIRFRGQEMKMVVRERQTNDLFMLSRRLGSATSVDEVVEISMYHIKKYFSINAFFILIDGKQFIEQKYIPEKLEFTEDDLAKAVWSFKNDKATGRFTDILSEGKYTYYPLKGTNPKLGVAVAQLDKPWDGKTMIFWNAFLVQIAQAIEHQHMGQLASKTSLLDESDKLYKTLFNSISHELRIPVATIMGASDILLTDQHPEPVKAELYGEIMDASKRLNRLIENLLNMSRLESGRIAARVNWCDVHDLFQSVTESLEEELRPFTIDISIPKTMPMVMLDFGLMEQVVYNLVYNSSLYAPLGTTIRLKATCSNNFMILQVTDRGAGFEPKDLPFVFDKFWRPKHSKAGGLGLGLSIVKGFVEAHKGTVAVENRNNGGARFTIQIPMEKSKENDNLMIWSS